MNDLFKCVYSQFYTISKFEEILFLFFVSEEFEILIGYVNKFRFNML